MKIPKQVTVGKKKYGVRVVRTLGRGLKRGFIEYGPQRITLATHDVYSLPYAASEKRETFWHELTHAILKDMGRDELCSNERFVSSFSGRLSKAIDSAKF